VHALEEHRAALAGRTLAELFAADADRFSRLSLSWDQWLADWSKQRVTPQAMDALVAFAHERNLPAWISALFSGEKINLSEGRPVLHTALRQQDDTPLVIDGSDVIAQVRAAQARVRTLAAQVRGGLRLGASGRQVTGSVLVESLTVGALSSSSLIESRPEEANMLRASVGLRRVTYHR